MTVRQSSLASIRMTSVTSSAPAPVRSRRWGWRLAGLLFAGSLFSSAGSLFSSAGSLFAQPPAPGGTMEAAGSASVSSNEGFMLPPGEASGSASYSSPPGSRFLNPLYPNEAPSVGGYGVKGRIGAQAGTTVGQSQPITNFDLSPYLFENNLYLFGEGRIALGNDGKTGGSLGAGGRYFFPQINSILGASGWLDVDATRGPTFRQWGISTELLTEFLDVRGNLYAPYGEITKVTGIRLEQGSQQFIDRPPEDLLPGDPAGALGTYLSFQRRIFSSTALQGFDTLFTIPLPGEFAQTLNLEASAGFYGYEARDGSVKQTYGWRARFDIDLFEHLSHMFFEVNQDKAFKTNVAFGADINYWHKLEHRPRLGHSQYNRLAEWVRRNRTTVALESSTLAERELAINPLTNRPYVIYQVLQTDQISHGGNGTLANPFQNLQDAINATGTGDPLRPSDFVDFVHGNSVIENSITIGPNYNGLQVIGEISDASYGLTAVGLNEPLPLPVVTNPPFDTPTIQNVIGTAVTLSSNNTTFAGFDLFNITGDGIFAGPGISGGNISDVKITTVNSGHGVNFTGTTSNSADPSSSFNFNNVSLTDIEGDAIHVQGGNANIIFTGTSRIDNASNSHLSHGYAVNVEDAAGAVNLGGVTIDDTGGNGIRIYGSAPGTSTARVTLGLTTLTDTVVLGPSGSEIATGAVYIRNHGGSVTFNDTLNINGIDAVLGGNSLVVEALQSSGSIFSQSSVNITGRRGHGIYVVDSAETVGTTDIGTNDVTFQNLVSISSLGAGYIGDDSAVLFQSYSGGVNFSNGLVVSGSRGDGVEVTAGTAAASQGTSRGRFVANNVRISNVSGAGGTTGVSFHVHDMDKTNFLVNTNSLSISNRGSAGSDGLLGQGIRVVNFDGQGSFLGATQVANELLSNAIGIDIENNSSTGNNGIGFGQTTVSDQRGAGSFGVLAFNNMNSVSFSALNVTSSAATAVSLQDNQLVSIGSGELNATGARAIEVFTDTGVTPIQKHDITLTSVSATASDVGILVVNSEGQFTVTGSSGVGGTISGMSIAGAYFEETQTADLNRMLFTNNAVGVAGITLVATDTSTALPLLRIADSTITSSASEGIFARDVSNFNLQNSVVSDNGATNNQEQIEIFSATDIGFVNAVFNNNNITDSLTRVTSGTDMIYIHNTPGLPTTSELNVIITNNGSPTDVSNLNSITANRGNGDAAISIVWAGGPTTATFNNNRMNINGTGAVGVNLATNGSDTTINYTNNSLNARGNSSIGIQGIFQQPTFFNASNNQAFDADGFLDPGTGFLMAGTNSTGMSLQFLGTGNNIIINNNLMQFLQRGSQGIVFERVTGNGDTNISIGGNSIYRPLPTGNVVNGGQTVGIYVQSVLGTINLINTGDNFVENGGVFPFLQYYDFLMTNPNQAGGTTISVNGNLVP